MSVFAILEQRYSQQVPSLSGLFRHSLAESALEILYHESREAAMSTENNVHLSTVQRNRSVENAGGLSDYR